jgi:RNA polymerase primary sigma factor
MTFDTTPHEHLIKVQIRRLKIFLRGALSYDDLMQTGRIALIHAHQKFDPSKGVKFETYANYWVKQRLYKECAECGYPVRYPPNSWRNLKIKHGKRPGFGGSLDSPAAEDGDSRKDLLPDRNRVLVDEAARDAQIQADADAVMAEVLNEREAEVVRCVSRGDTLVATGERIGVSRERVRQLYARSIQRVRTSPRVAELAHYLEAP